MIPAAAAAYLPLLVATAMELWPAAPQPWTMAAQVEVETCRTPTHAQCWSPRAELRTPRENGVGFGQITRAYRADGSIRFDTQAELRAQYPRELGRWTWANRWDPALQMAGLVLLDRREHARLAPLAATPADAWAFVLSAYNGGYGGLVKDRMRCSNTAGCDPTRWAGNVAVHSVKSRTALGGYGRSAYAINRAYVERVLRRAPDYAEAWQ